MITGDLNATLNANESWGISRKKDPLADCIRFELLHRNLIDIRPSKVLPTWDNGRIDGAYITKGLDRFILHVSIIDKLGMPFSTIGNVFISDHRPILLSWREKEFRRGYSFKFNRYWLEESDFNDVVKKTWKELSETRNRPPFLTFREKISHMQKVVKEW